MFFSLVSSLWPATIPIFYAFGPRLNVIEDPCYKVSADSYNQEPLGSPKCNEKSQLREIIV